MSDFAIMPLVVKCPVCGKAPHIEQCAPWPKEAGAPGWYAVCFSYDPHEHCVGVNGDNRLAAIRNWNAEAAKVEATPAAAL